MPVTLLKRRDKTPQLVSMLEHLSFGLVESAAANTQRTHGPAENTHRSGVHKSPGSHVQFMREPKKWVRKSEALQPRERIRRGLSEALCASRASAVPLSVFPLLRCLSRHTALCFGPSVSTPRSCVDLICDVALYCSALALAFPLCASSAIK